MTETKKRNYTKKATGGQNPTAPTHKRSGRKATDPLAKLEHIERSVTESMNKEATRRSSVDKIKLGSLEAEFGLPSMDKAKKYRSAPARKAGQRQSANAADASTPQLRKGSGRKKSSGEKLRVMMLGGMQEIGKNMAVLEYGEDMLIVDCGVAFPDDDMFGIDLVIPDITYLTKNRSRIRGIVLTHGHEDHIGSIPYVLQELNVPVYGTAMTMGIIRYKLEEFKYQRAPRLNVVRAGDTVRLGAFSVEFVHVNHSIADACALAITTPVGVVFHTGDFKLDVSPMDGQMMDLRRISEIGDRGVLLLMGESTNAERPGFTPSERSLGSSFDQIFLLNPKKRIIVATFSSNVHRVQQVIGASLKFGRKIAILGRSMVNVIGAARELGYIDIPEESLIDISDIKRYRPEQLTLITTGSQGEPMSALYRIAFGDHDKVKLTTSDLVILSASAIPGNEKFIGKIVNAMIRSGIKVVNDRSADVHVSGHACAEELKMMLAMTKPKYFMPIHGETRHLYAHKEIAEFMGIPSSHIFVADLGQVVELDRHSASMGGAVPSGKVMVDGTGVGDVGSAVLRDRRALAEEGLIIAMVSLSTMDQTIVAGPEIISRGYVYMKESEGLLDEARMICAKAIGKALKRGSTDINAMKNSMKEELTRFFYSINKRRPVIIPVIMTV